MSTESKRPTHRILQVEDRGEGKKAYWREVGVGFTNGDGSINLVFQVIPMIGQHTIQMRPFEDKKDEDEAPKGSGSRSRK